MEIGGTIGLVIRACLYIRAIFVMLAPVFVFGGGIKHLGHAFTGQGTDHPADAGAYGSAHRTGSRTYRGTRSVAVPANAPVTVPTAAPIVPPAG
jgi:hypothetical protein